MRRWEMALQRAELPSLVLAGSGLASRVKVLGGLQRGDARAMAALIDGQRQALAAYTRAVGEELRRRGAPTRLRGLDRPLDAELAGLPTASLQAAVTWLRKEEPPLGEVRNLPLNTILALDLEDELARRRRRTTTGAALAALLATGAAAAAMMHGG